MKFRLFTVAASVAISMTSALTPCSSSSPLIDSAIELTPAQKVYTKLRPYYLHMEKLVEEGRFIDVIKMDKPFNHLFEGMDCSQMDLEDLCYIRTMALHNSFFGLAEQSMAEIRLQNAYYEKAIDTLSNYLSEYGDRTSRYSRCQLTLLSHRSLFFKLLGDKQSLLAVSFGLFGNLDRQFFYTESAVKSYLSAINNIKSTLAISDISKLEVAELTELENGCQFQLVQLYCNLAQYENSISSPNFIEAKKFCAIIKKTNRTMHKQALGFLQVVENLLASDRTTRQISGFRHSSTKKLLRKKADRYNNKALATHAHNNKAGASEDLRVKVNRLYSGIKSSSFNGSEECYAQLEEQIIILESTISNELKVSEETPRLERLRIIYHYLSELSTENDLRNCFHTYTLGLGKHADIDGAIDRLEIIRQIQIKKLGQTDILNQILLAHLKILRGEPDEWLALEQENMTKASKKNEKKKRQKAKKRLAQASAIAASIEHVKEEQEKKAEQLEEQKANLEAARMREKASSDKGKEEASDFYDDTAHETYVRREQEKQEKRERHERALQARADRERLAAAEPAFLEEVVESQAQEEESNIDEDLQIGELYQLTGVAAEVESQIANNTWKITREDLEQYFVAMNCVYKEGKGSHGKLQLPKSMHVEKDGQVLTIFIESGGAVTLPSWDKGYLPDYLKRQVLVAREKLRALAIKALME